MDNREIFASLIAETKKLGPKESFERLERMIPSLSSEELAFLTESYGIYDYIRNMFLYLSDDNIRRSLAVIDFKAIDYLEFFTNIANITDMEKILDRFEKILPPQADEDYEGLEAFLDKLLSDGANNEYHQIGCWQALRNFVIRRQQMIKPAWILDSDGVELTEGICNPFVTLEQDKYDALAETDIEIFRSYGPINRKISCDTTVTDADREQHDCLRMGCRMFSCFECLDPDFDDYEYSFDDPNVCDSCGRRIHDNCWALREPLTAGGWGGWFCREKCLRRLARDTQKVDIMMKLINRYGIYQRRKN